MGILRLLGYACAAFAMIVMTGCATSAPTFSQDDEKEFYDLIKIVQKGDYYNDYQGDTKRGLKEYDKACKAGLGLACWFIAYETEAEKDIERAEEVLKDDCFAESPSVSTGQSCLYLGIMLSQEFLSVTKAESAYNTERELYEKACDLGEGFACYRLAHDFIQEDDINEAYKITDKAHKLLDTLCEKGIGFYCGEAGDMFQYSIGDWDIENGGQDEMMRYYQKGCDLGDGRSCAALR